MRGLSLKGLSDSLVLRVKETQSAEPAEPGWAGSELLQQPQDRDTEGPREDLPATHVLGYFFSPAPPQRAFGSAVCGKTLKLHFAPWRGCLQIPAGSVKVSGGRTPLRDHLPKGDRRESEALAPLAGTVKSDSHRGRKAARRSEYSRSPGPGCLCAGLHFPAVP
jgi:hypothetical protein